MDAKEAVAKIEAYVNSLRSFAADEHIRLSGLAAAAQSRSELATFAQARNEYWHSVQLLDTVLLGVRNVQKDL